MRKFVRIIFLITNMFFIICLLLAYLCCFVSPESVWWLSFFGLGYLYLLIVNICFVLFWCFTKNKKFALLSLTVILAGWNIIWRNIQISGEKLPETESGSSIKVLSYNVHIFQKRETKQPDGANLNLFDYINESGTNIVCMQEYANSRWTKELSAENIARQLDRFPYYHVEHTMDNVGIATYSSFPIIKNQLIYSDNTSNACMFSDLKIGQDTVRVYNIHLKSIGFSVEERELLNNAIKKEYHSKDISTFKAIVRQMVNASSLRSRQVDIVAESISQSPYPVIICGDFNDPPTSYSYQTIRGSRKEAFKESGKGLSLTYTIGRFFSQRIDYIMYSPSFKAYDYEKPQIYFSDHYPVTCRLVRQ